MKYFITLMMILSTRGIDGCPGHNYKAGTIVTKQPVIPIEPAQPRNSPDTGDYQGPSFIMPGSGTVWKHGQSSNEIRWTGVDGSLVKFILYREGLFITEITGWEDNDGICLVTVLPVWGSGDGYRIGLESTGEPSEMIWSDEFRISANVTIVLPSYGTVWSHGQSDADILWSGTQGSQVDITLYRNGDIASNIASSVPDAGSYILPVIPSSWGTGDSYRIIVRDDLGNQGESGRFSINAIYVAQPASGTVWTDSDDQMQVLWTGGTRITRVILYRGEDRIRTLAEWNDNTGNSVFTDSVLDDLLPADNYRVIVEDDQGNRGSSEPFSVQFSDNVANGAVEIVYPTDRGCFESDHDRDIYLMPSALSPGERYRIDIGSTSGDVSIAITGSDPDRYLETGMNSISFRYNGAMEYIVLENQNSSSWEYSVRISRIRTLEFINPRLMTGWPITLINGSGSSDLSRTVNFGVITMRIRPKDWMECGWHWFAYKLDDRDMGYDLGSINHNLFYIAYPYLLSRKLSVSAGIGYDLVTVSEEDIYRGSFTQEEIDHLESMESGTMAMLRTSYVLLGTPSFGGGLTLENMLCVDGSGDVYMTASILIGFFDSYEKEVLE